MIICRFTLFSSPASKGIHWSCSMYIGFFTRADAAKGNDRETVSEIHWHFCHLRRHPLLLIDVFPSVPPVFSDRSAWPVVGWSLENWRFGCEEKHWEPYYSLQVLREVSDRCQDRDEETTVTCVSSWVRSTVETCYGSCHSALRSSPSMTLDDKYWRRNQNSGDSSDEGQHSVSTPQSLL